MWDLLTADGEVKGGGFEVSNDLKWLCVGVSGDISLQG